MHQDFSSCGFFWPPIFPSGVTFKICVEFPEHVQPIYFYDRLLNQVAELHNAISQGDNSDYLPGNDAKMLSPYNFPMVVVGIHRGNHLKQYLDCILANTVREGSLFVTETFTYTFCFKQAF